jgi:diaminopimelate epimerase
MCSPDSPTGWETDRVRLTKHHGLANDFLVVLDETNERAPTVDGALAVRLCDRRTGIGADGLIHGVRPADGVADLDVEMHLYNADGGRAEMSGNGIRCLVQAVAAARGLAAGTFRVGTDGGLRMLEIAPDPAGNADLVQVSVDMGPARPGPDVPLPVESELRDRHATVDMGNPHLVIESDDPKAVDLATRGAWLERQFDGGVNVEFIAKDDGRPDAIVLRVWERGAGITMACGTGACAAARVAHEWGIVGDTVTVAMPGGDARVQLGDHLVLVGPSAYIATIEVPDGR